MPIQLITHNGNPRSLGGKAIGHQVDGVFIPIGARLEQVLEVFRSIQKDEAPKPDPRAKEIGAPRSANAALDPHHDPFSRW